MKTRDNVPAAGGFFLEIWLKLAYFSYILTLFLSKSGGAKTYFGPLTLKSEGAMAPWPPRFLHCGLPLFFEEKKSLGLCF